MAKLKLTCPPTQQATSLDGEPVAVSWPDARTIGGQAPVVVLYGVKSGSKFPVGTVNVPVKAKSADNQSSHCSFSITVTAADQPPELVPLPPTQLVGAVTGPSQIDLSWQEKPGNKTGFPIERHLTGAGNFQEIDVAPPTQTIYHDTTVATDTTSYDYRVKARNASGDSGYSNVITVGPVQLADLYVATTGLDTNPGTLAQPFRTFAKASSVLAPGKTLAARGGIYPEALLESIPSGTSWSAPVRLTVYPGEPVTLAPSGTMHVLSFAKAQQYIEVTGINLDGRHCSTDVVRIYGLSAAHNAHHIRIQGTAAQKAEILIAAGNHDHTQGIQCTGSYGGAIGACEFRYLSMHGGGTTDFDNGLYLQSPQNLVEWCELADIYGAAVQIYNGNAGGSSPDGNIVRYSIIRDLVRTDDRCDGIIVLGNQNQFISNLIYNLQPNPSGANGGAGASGGIFILGGTGNQSLNNTLADMQCAGLRIDGAASGTIIRNTISFANNQNLVGSGSGLTQDHNLIDGTNPVFINAPARNYRLGNGSPGLDRGATITDVVFDLDGIQRPVGAAYNIGAYESL